MIAIELKGFAARLERILLQDGRHEYLVNLVALTEKMDKAAVRQYIKFLEFIAAFLDDLNKP